MKTKILICICTCLVSLVRGQEIKIMNPAAPGTILFRDTMNGIVTDSFSHDLGDIPPENIKLIKCFRYVGKESIRIIRAFTGDPHYICEYPQEDILPGHTYSITVCFANRSSEGYFLCSMDLLFSNGRSVRFTFSGRVHP